MILEYVTVYHHVKSQKKKEKIHTHTSECVQTCPRPLRFGHPVDGRAPDAHVHEGRVLPTRSLLGHVVVHLLLRGARSGGLALALHPHQPQVQRIYQTASKTAPKLRKRTPSPFWQSEHVGNQDLRRCNTCEKHRRALKISERPLNTRRSLAAMARAAGSVESRTPPP